MKLNLMILFLFVYIEINLRNRKFLKIMKNKYFSFIKI